MLFRFDDFDRAFEMVNQIQRRLDRALDSERTASGVGLHETEDALFVSVDLPGVGEDDLEITLKEEVLTLAGKRGVEPPEGYRAHIQERRPYSFTRSFSLPSRVEADNVTARFTDGVLTVELPKAEAAKPRQISLSA